MNESNQSIDRELESLLDAALSPQNVPGGIPANLSDRIVAATIDQLPDGHVGVIGRINHSSVRWLAAAIVLAAWTASWAVGGVIVRDARTLVAFERIALVADHTAGVDTTYDAIDTDIQALALRLELGDDRDEWVEQVADVQNSLDDWDDDDFTSQVGLF